MSTTQKEEKNQTNHSRLTRKQQLQPVPPNRMTSVSPVDRRRRSAASPVAFGRSISKERTFAEEKKRLEQNNPLCRRAAPFAGSTSILRNPDLKSPDEVKRAIKTTFQMPMLRTSSASRAPVHKCSSELHTGNVQSGGSSSSRFERNVNRTMSVTTTTASKCRENATTLTKSTSNVSLTRTNSTYSIDSTTSSRRKSHSGRRSPQTITSAKHEKIASVVVINGKQRRKKTTAAKEKLNSATITKKSHHHQLHDSINAEIHSKSRQHRGSAFFQQLFMRDLRVAPSPPPLVIGAVQQRVNVWDKILDRPARVVADASVDRAPPQWNHLLMHRQPVTASRFHLAEYEQRLRQSRSLSPQRRRQQHSRQTFVHFTANDEVDEEHQQQHQQQQEFGYRSRSVPTTGELCLTEVIEPNRPLVIHGRTMMMTTTTATKSSSSAIQMIRSPSCRRIHSHRSATATATPPTVHKIRARSAGVPSKDAEQDDEQRFNSLDSALNTSHSIGALNVDASKRCYQNHHSPASRPCERFRDLNRFYADLERVEQLEKATSSTDIRPIRRRGELIDFEEWRKLRQHERAERELNTLRGRLKQNERDKDFLFRAKYPEDIRWSEQADSGLRCKEKSVEDLKEILRERTWHERPDADTDRYKSLWRGSSVLDVASNMTHKYGGDEPAAPATASATLPNMRRKPKAAKGLGISDCLIGALTDDQVSRIETQLCEINDESAPDAVHDPKYVVNVSGDKRTERHAGLTVRCNSAISKEDLFGPMLLRHQARVAENMKTATPAQQQNAAESHGNVRVSRSVDRFEHIIRNAEQRALSESEKRNILHNISKEICDKIGKRRQQADAPYAEVLVPKETRGAVASSKAQTSQRAKPAHFLDERSTEEPEKVVPVTSVDGNDNDDNDDDDGIDEPTKEALRKVDDTIEYFERKMEEPPPEPTVYKACDYSSPDEDDVCRLVTSDDNRKQRSTSATDFRELFGETTQRSLTPLRDISPPAPASNSTSVESVFRSRSISPIVYRSKSAGSDVHRIRNHFECLTLPKPAKARPELTLLQRHQSDPELHQPLAESTAVTLPPKLGTAVPRHESGDVSWITHKFETRNWSQRSSRSRCRHIRSPVPRIVYRTAVDRLMPHIDIISKTAALKSGLDGAHNAPTRRQPGPLAVAGVRAGDVRKMRRKFESAAASERMSMLGQMYTSSPDVSELRDISTYLSGDWVAHRYPHRNDNARSPGTPERGPIGTEAKRIKALVYRTSSASPPRIRSRISPLLKPFYRQQVDWLLDDGQEDDDGAEKRRRAASERADRRAEELWSQLLLRGYASGRNCKPLTVQFQGVV